MFERRMKICEMFISSSSLLIMKHGTRGRVVHPLYAHPCRIRRYYGVKTSDESWTTALRLTGH